jgi:hypothetical protein
MEGLPGGRLDILITQQRAYILMAVRLFQGMNKTGDETKVDPDSFRFHGTMKALFYKVLRLINPPPKKWTDEIDGNIGVLRDIYYDYIKHEKQEWRKGILTRVMPFSLCLAKHDENYEEVIQWFLYQIIQRQNEFEFTKLDINPKFWYQEIVEAYYGKKD